MCQNSNTPIFLDQIGPKIWDPCAHAPTNMNAPIVEPVKFWPFNSTIDGVKLLITGQIKGDV